MQHPPMKPSPPVTNMLGMAYVGQVLGGAEDVLGSLE